MTGVAPNCELSRRSSWTLVPFWLAAKAPDAAWMENCRSETFSVAPDAGESTELICTVEFEICEIPQPD